MTRLKCPEKLWPLFQRVDTGFTVPHITSRQIDGFFYGLFMDAEVLRQAGMKPAKFRRAYVSNLALRIGQRAALVPSPGSRAYGMVISMTHAELERLYSAPGLEVYRPEAVIAQPFDGEAIAALCYNLVTAPEAHERNPDYATRLKSVLQKLDFPAEYIESIS